MSSLIVPAPELFGPLVGVLGSGSALFGAYRPARRIGLAPVPSLFGKVDDHYRLDRILRYGKARSPVYEVR